MKYKRVGQVDCPVSLSNLVLHAQENCIKVRAGSCSAEQRVTAFQLEAHGYTFRKMAHSLYQSKWAPASLRTMAVDTVQSTNTANSRQSQQERPASSTHVQRTTAASPTPLQPFFPHSLFESKWAPRPDGFPSQATPLSELAPQSACPRQQGQGHQHTDEDIPTSEPEEQICPICQAPAIDPIWTPCAHVFCSEDLALWLKDNASCPTCRTRCSYDEVFNSGNSQQQQTGRRRRRRRGRGNRQAQQHDLPQDQGGDHQPTFRQVYQVPVPQAWTDAIREMDRAELQRRGAVAGWN